MDGWSTLILLLLLALATWVDLRTNRVPNAIVLAGILLAFVLAGAAAGPRGLAAAMAGMFVAGRCLLPFYLGGGMGAGDVKLMAMVGAFLGPLGALSAVALTLVAGLLLSGAALLATQAMASGFGLRLLSSASARMPRPRRSTAGAHAAIPVCHGDPARHACVAVVSRRSEDGRRTGGHVVDTLARKALPATAAGAGSQMAARPATISETGLSHTFLDELLVKHLHASGALTLRHLTERLALSGSIVEALLGFLRRDGRAEVHPARGSDPSILYALTGQGSGDGARSAGTQAA
jgi:Flp pilus assembly protein protease CpaA